MVGNGPKTRLVQCSVRRSVGHADGHKSQGTDRCSRVDVQADLLRGFTIGKEWGADGAGLSAIGVASLDSNIMTIVLTALRQSTAAAFCSGRNSDKVTEDDRVISRMRN
jgi:hypothetical protein